ncbi:MAG TPA: hypothetical protein VFL82_13895 [Thermomicrobiales bacterium]|nr:hypothetical protein [Thermomicrobiales bacterium]
MVANVQPSEALKKLLERHQAEAERLRQEMGDPEEALSAFVRAHFDIDILEDIFNEMIEGESLLDDETRFDDR